MDLSLLLSAVQPIVPTTGALVQVQILFAADHLLVIVVVVFPCSLELIQTSLWPDDDPVELVEQWEWPLKEFDRLQGIRKGVQFVMPGKGNAITCLVEL